MRATWALLFWLTWPAAADWTLLIDEQSLKLASFKEEQLPYHSEAACHVGAAVLVHVARSGQLDAALR